MAVETCEIHQRQKGRRKWVWYAKVIGPRGVDESEEWPEFLETYGFGAGGSLPGKAIHPYNSKKNQQILDRFISHLVQSGWEYVHPGGYGGSFTGDYGVLRRVTG